MLGFEDLATKTMEDKKRFVKGVTSEMASIGQKTPENDNTKKILIEFAKELANKAGDGFSEDTIMSMAGLDNKGLLASNSQKTNAMMENLEGAFSNLDNLPIKEVDKEKLRAPLRDAETGGGTS